MKERRWPGRALPTKVSGPVTLGTQRVLGRVGPSPGSALHNAFASSGHRLRGPFAHITPRRSHREELTDVHRALKKCPSTGRENAASRREVCMGPGSAARSSFSGPLPAWPGPVLHSRAFCICSVTSSTKQQRRPSPREQPRGGRPLPSLEGLHSPKSYSEAFRPDSWLVQLHSDTSLSYWQEGEPAPVPGPASGNQVPASHHGLSVLPLSQPLALWSRRPVRPLHPPPGRLQYPTCFPTSTYTPSVGVSRPLAAGRRSGKARLRVSEVRSWGLVSLRCLYCTSVSCCHPLQTHTYMSS